MDNYRKLSKKTTSSKIMVLIWALLVWFEELLLFSLHFNFSLVHAFGKKWKQNFRNVIYHQHLSRIRVGNFSVRRHVPREFHQSHIWKSPNLHAEQSSYEISSTAKWINHLSVACQCVNPKKIVRRGCEVFFNIGKVHNIYAAIDETWIWQRFGEMYRRIWMEIAGVTQFYSLDCIYIYIWIC